MTNKKNDEAPKVKEEETPKEDEATVGGYGTGKDGKAAFTAVPGDPSVESK